MHSLMKSRLTIPRLIDSFVGYIGRYHGFIRYKSLTSVMPSCRSRKMASAARSKISEASGEVKRPCGQ